MATQGKKSRYVYALIKELEHYKNKLQHIKTIYIGGGTPTSLDEELLSLLLKKINSVVNMRNVQEYTIEANPNDITDRKAFLFFRYGINRVSMGVQTFNQKHLDFLGRAHTKEDIYHGVRILQNSQVTNINIDMIFSLPNQTIEELKEDIEHALELDIPHISYYSLIFEEKTKLYHLYEQKKVNATDEDLEALMYNTVIDSIKESGYTHYEISNFSKTGYESKHNMVYWKNKDYLGLGSGSHSLLENKRFFNERNVRKYIENLENGDLPTREFEEIEPLREELIMGLRLLNGVNIKDIEFKYNVSLFKLYPELNDFIDKKILQLDKHNLYFTRDGLLLGNLVFGIF